MVWPQLSGQVGRKAALRVPGWEVGRPGEGPGRKWEDLDTSDGLTGSPAGLLIR